MKLKVKIMLLRGNIDFPKIIDKGDWIDLYAAKNVKVKSIFNKKTSDKDKEKSIRITDSIKYIPLGVAMELPDGFEAIVAPRSSTPKKFGIICPNSFGVIDNSYKSQKDEWMFPAIGLKNTTICEGDRICQFRIQLSQKSNFWHKLKWFLSSGIELKQVSKLDNLERGGLGSTN